jgi:hypothetical protein
MKKFVRFGLALTVLATALMTNAIAEDPIAAWNKISENAVKAGNHPLPVTSVEFAIVQLAIYDAVESIDGHYEPYYTRVPGATGSLSAAAAKAGHDTLVGLFPAQSTALDAAYADFLAMNGVDPLDPGTEVGAHAAANILALRANDGRFPLNPPPFLGSTAIGQWRPTPSLLAGPPPTLQPGLTPWLANVRPFAMHSGSQFRVDPPPDLTSQLWADDYNETKTVGSLTSTTRTAEQTEIGYFWADSGPLLWQNALRYISGNSCTTLATRLACLRWLMPPWPMLRSPAGTASTFTTFGVRSLPFGWETRTAIQPRSSILIGSRSSTHPIFPSTPLVTPTSVARSLICCDFSSVVMS